MSEQQLCRRFANRSRLSIDLSLVTRPWSSRQGARSDTMWILQIHGFAADKHPGYPSMEPSEAMRADDRTLIVDLREVLLKR